MPYHSSVDKRNYKPASATTSVVATVGIVLLAMLLSLTPIQASAALVFAPDFPNSQNHPATFGATTLLSASHRLMAMAGSSFDDDNDSMTQVGPFQAPLRTAGGVNAEFIQPGRNPILAGGSGEATAYFGTLKGLAQYEAKSGPGMGDLSFVVDFVDVLHVEGAGSPNSRAKFDVNFAVNGNVAGSRAPEVSTNPSFANALVTSELYIWPFGPIPLPGVLFDFVDYAKSDFMALRTPQAIVTDPHSIELFENASYWVCGRMEIRIRSTANSILEFTPTRTVGAFADFSHTTNLFIDPSAENPNATYTMASGVDLQTPAPVPLPSAVWLLCSALGGLVLARRRPTAKVVAKAPI